MSRTVFYQSRLFNEAAIVKQYAAKHSSGFVIFDVNAKGYTIRETRVTPDELTAEIIAQCEACADQAFNQVELKP